MILEWLIVAAIFGTIIYLLKWNTVKKWITSHRMRPSDTVKICMKKLQSGEYKVVAGIFPNAKNINRGSLTESTYWECQTMDEELVSKFNGEQEITIR